MNVKSIGIDLAKEVFQVHWGVIKTETSPLIAWAISGDEETQFIQSS
ncbi:TPA: hypothetical protein PXN30_002069 [Yersinia enterocolitica]|nr:MULTISPECIES: hypothetical protein [Yersinia]EKN4146352.1 hypothetical protein [Yersinia enterocolitica]ELZ1903464.1 hypothetical protein [Yersinia enterocolitica]MCB5326452.1 hypothetical protein [Yersinia intermedia]HDL7197419.1 hypothetical protein [Yersinia enterocolitica]HDL7361194.1 hypothetical protein [Yersinia enterocolitica]